MRRLRWLAGLLLTGHLLAQQPARPRLGLVLGGGGAKGLAHIGVLHWLEEHHVPVDMIAGTSMGGLVGGLYATGENIADLEHLIEGVDWNEILRGDVPYQQLAYRRKEDKRAFPNSLEFGVKRNGLALPSSLNPAQEIALLLHRAALPYSQVENFDELGVAFRCVATDLLSGERVVLKQGSLAQALLATMAIPGVFPPVAVDGRLLVDGGVLNNLPTEVARDMGADVIVAVQLPATATSREELASLANVLARSAAIAILDNERRSKALASTLLVPEVQAYSNQDYTSAPAIIALGYAAAERNAAALQRLAVSPEEWQRWQASRQTRLRRRPARIDFVVVSGTKPEIARNLQKQLSEDLAGRPFEEDRVATRLTEVVGLGRFERATYELVRQQGLTGIRVELQEKSYGPNILLTGFDIDGSDIGSVNFTFNTRLTMLDVGRFGSEWRNDLSLGYRTRLGSEFYRRVGRYGWFVAPRVLYTRNLTDLYANRVRFAQYELQRGGAGLDLGFSHGRFTEWRLGQEIGRLQALPRIGPANDEGQRGLYQFTRLRVVNDHLENPVLPRTGWRVQAEGQWWWQAPQVRSVPVLTGQGSYHHPVDRRSAWFVRGEGATTVRRMLPLYQQVSIGGPFGLTAFRPEELRGLQFLTLSAGYFRELITLPPLLGGRLYAVTWYQAARLEPTGSQVETIHAGSLGFVVQTALGPIFVGGSIANDGRGRASFVLGRLF